MFVVVSRKRRGSALPSGRELVVVQVVDVVVVVLVGVRGEVECVGPQVCQVVRNQWMHMWCQILLSVSEHAVVAGG